MSTPRDIVTQALGLSLKNRPTTAGVENELRLVVNRALRQHWAAGCRINPRYFAAFVQVPSVTTTWSAGFWARPEDAEIVFQINNPASAAVKVVPADQAAAFQGYPAVQRWDGGYLGFNGPAGPSPTDALTLYYARRPAEAAAVDTPLDALWPAAYDGLLVMEVAIYLARKDGRADEQDALLAERDAWFTLYKNFLEHETLGEERLFHPDRFTEISEKPLAGGTPT